MESEKFRIAYFVKKSKIVVVTNLRILIIDEGLTEQEIGQLVNEFHAGCKEYSLLNKSFNSRDGCFLICVSMSVEPSRFEYKSEYFTPFLNFDKYKSWIMKVNIRSDGRLEKIEPATNSMLVWYEKPEAILEYAPDKIVVSLKPRNFLFIKNWVPVRHL